MALPSTLHHFDLRITHADTGVEAAIAIKTARHPSETIERLWLRVLAYAWQWQEGIALGPGLCEPEAPDVLALQPDGHAALVVRVGKPEPQRVERDVTGNAGARVAVLFESPRRLETFVAEARERRLGRLARAELAAADPALLAWLSRQEGRRTRVGLTFVADHVYAELDGESADGPLQRATV